MLKNIIFISNCLLVIVATLAITWWCNENIEDAFDNSKTYAVGMPEDWNDKPVME